MREKIRQVLLNERFILVVILINSVLIYAQVSGYENYFMGILDTICTFIFLFEMIVKHKEYGVKGYWSDGWNRLDGSLVILSLPSTATCTAFLPCAAFLPELHQGHRRV